MDLYDQSGVVPYRLIDGRLDVLLVSSRSGKRWTIPKGVIEDDLSAADSAAKEALEEAGIEGRVLPQPVGRYTYRKWGGRCNVEVFAMAVDKTHDEWPDADLRERRWLDIEAAIRTDIKKGLRKILVDFPGFLEQWG